MLINRIPVLFIAGALTHFSPATAASGDLEARVMMGQPLSSPCPMYAAYDQDSKSCSCYSVSVATDLARRCNSDSSLQGYSPTYGRHGRLMSCSATAYSLPAGSYCLVSLIDCAVLHYS